MIRIGTAGWTIPRESADSFPASGTHLQRYSTRFTAVEINSSFYRPHRVQTYARWAASVGPEFRFSVKAPKRITHELRLQQAEPEVKQFLAEVLTLGDRLGGLLVQLPPSLGFIASVATHFCAHLREHYPGAIVIEPRHASWCAPEVDEILRQYDVGRVAADPDPTACASTPGGSPILQYYRLHGAPRVYYSAYSQDYLQRLAHALAAVDVPAAEIWCMFDNTAAGNAAADALRLQTLLLAVSGSGNSEGNHNLVPQPQEMIMAKKAATGRAPKKGTKKAAPARKTATKKAVKKAAPKKSAPKKAAKKAARPKAAKRELIAPRGDKRLIRRDERGRIKESDDLSRSLSQDRRRSAKKAVKPGQGDKGDRKPARKSK